MRVIQRPVATLLLFLLVSPALSQTPRPPFSVKRTESSETWKRDGWNAIDQAKKQKIRTGKAKNVILFIGDGMGIPSLTAGRIFEAQQRGESGEENRLSFEEFPFSALSKTYSVNQQTSDSASTMSAIITGVKTNGLMLSVNQNVTHGDHRLVKGNESQTLLELAENAGRSTGIVTTTRVTHATPGACYAHTADRNWESDKDIFNHNKNAHEAKFPDIARQLIEFPHGDGLDVALGGGRQKFLPKDAKAGNAKGERLDGRDLTREWVDKAAGSQYVSTGKQLAAVDHRNTKHLLGLFNAGHMEFEFSRVAKGSDEPSLSEMTSKAIDILALNKKGFFLMVEGGRIDHGHHSGNAFRALSETVELSNAVRTALKKVDLDETLVIVTADHNHTMTMMGYPVRGNNILGLVRDWDEGGKLNPDYERDKLGLPYTTLNYVSGRGYPGESSEQPEGAKRYPTSPRTVKGMRNGRPDLSTVDTTDPNFLQEAMIPLGDETHGGEDVAIFATGVNAHLIRGSMEQNWIFYVMADAFRLGRK